MKITIIFVIVFGWAGKCVGQNKFLTPAENINKRRLVFTSLTLSTCYISGTYALNSIWYSEFEKSKFHFFNDGSEWLQMDKIGHVYTSNKLASALTHQFLWTGLDSNKSILFGSVVSFGFQTTLEVLDARSSGWGFSWYDMAANTTGVLLFSLQQKFWKNQHFLLKFSDHMTSYANIRPEILGHTPVERLLKDYNGQSYWLSFSPQLIFPRLKVPRWVCLSVGYGINQKLNGKNNYYFDVNSNRSFNAHRKFLFSLDIDFSKLPIRNALLKKIVKPFNLVKIPFPTLILTNGHLHSRLIYF